MKDILFFNFYLFIYLFFGCIGSSLLRVGFLSSCGERGLLFVAVCGLLIAWLLLLWSMGSRCVGFSSCGMQAQ